MQLAPAVPRASTPNAGIHPVTAEPELRALLSQAIHDGDIPRLQQRKTALLSLFRAIPTAERDRLRARLHDPKDALGHLFQTALSTKLRGQLLATLDGAVVPAPAGSDSVAMSAFATSVPPARFHLADEVVLDGAWRTSQVVSVVAVPGFGPPADEPGPDVQWRLIDRMGERRTGGTVMWMPGKGAPPAIQVTIDQPGRWTVAIEIVDRGHVIAAIAVPIRARTASERGNDLPALLGGSELASSAEAMTDKQVSEQLGALRAQTGKHPLGSLTPNDPTYRKLAHAIEELQWQQHQRDLPSRSEPTPSFEAQRFDASTPGRRAAIQQAIDELISRYGIEGAKAHLHDMVVPPAGTGRGAGAAPVEPDPHAPEIERVLSAELALRGTEAASFLGRFDHQGRAIALGLLAESETRLRTELQRYGLMQAPAQIGGYGNQGSSSSGSRDVTALRDAIDQGKQIRAAHDRLLHAVQDRAAGGTDAVEQARQELEATQRIAVAKHPMLQMFLDPETRRGLSVPGGSVPGPLDLGRYETGAFARLMGWELNKKLGDLHATREHITDGTLSIFGVPKVVELVKANLHVAPGSVHDGIVNERAAHAHDGQDDSGVLALFSLALGLLLAIPTGGTSLVGAGIATAGEVTLLAADLYLLGKDLEQRNLYHAATNTDLSVADALLQEEPEAGPIVLRLLGVVGPFAGAAGVAKRVADVAHIARARQGIEAVRAVRRAAEAAGQVMTDPRVALAVEQLRPIAREAGMTDAELDALVRTIGRKGLGGAAHAATNMADATAIVTKDMAPQLARRLGVDEIEISGVAGEVGVHPTMRRGRVVAGKLVVGPSATVGDVMAHRGLVERLERYNGLAGKVRETWDQLAEAITGIERANPHAVFTGAHEAFAEARKYEAMIRRRMADMVGQLADNGTAGAAAASRIENEILMMEGELSHWRGVLDEVKRTGDPKLARGLIESRDIGKVTNEAVAAGYPPLPSDKYFYRRWPEGGPEGQEFQVIRADAQGPDPLVQPRRRGNGWVLEESEGSGKVPKAFEAALRDDQVLSGMLTESQSLRAYFAALTDPHGIGLPAAAVQARMRTVIERVRTPRGATAEQVAAGARRTIDEDNLRYALKAEFREEFFACAARETTPEAQMAKFRDLTQDLNPADLGHLREDFLARRDPGSVQHVVVKRADHPNLGLTARERHIDRVSTDGTAVEVKSIKGRFSSDDLAQLEDYKRMVDGKITAQVARKPTRIERAMYEFTEPAGVRANLTTIRKQMLERGISVKVYNHSGHARILQDDKDLIEIEEWLSL